MPWIAPVLGGLSSAAGIAGNVASLFGGNDKPKPTTQGFQGVITTPNYTFGAGKLLRNNSNISGNQNALYGQLGNLANEVRPGYGRLTDAGVNAIRNKAASQVGNLRAQQAKRGLSGASFANNELNNLQLSYDQAENEFRSQAFQQELAASQKLIEQQNQILQDQTTRELSELNLATNYLAVVKQGINWKKNIKQALAQYDAIAKIGGQVGQAAHGGPIEGGRPYLVGERGPELVIPSQNSMVIPNQMLGGFQAPSGAGPVVKVLQQGLTALSTPHSPNVLPYPSNPQNRALAGLVGKAHIGRGGGERGRSEAAGRKF